MLVQNGAQAEAQRLGYHVAMRWTHLPDEIEAFARSCVGLILVGPHSKAALARAYAVGTPIVRIGWLDPLEPVDQVSGTDHEAGAAVATYLLELGHRVIAYVHGAPIYRGRKERYYGMREVLEARDDTDIARHAVRQQRCGSPKAWRRCTPREPAPRPSFARMTAWG